MPSNGIKWYVILPRDQPTPLTPEISTETLFESLRQCGRSHSCCVCVWFVHVRSVYRDVQIVYKSSHKRGENRPHAWCCPMPMAPTAQSWPHQPRPLHHGFDGGIAWYFLGMGSAVTCCSCLVERHESWKQFHPKLRIRQLVT